MAGQAWGDGSYGSVAEVVLAHSPVPILLVRRTGPRATLAPPPARSCLIVPLDGSDLAEAALPHAATLALSFGCGIQLLSVMVPPELVYSNLGLTPYMLDASEIATRADPAKVNEYLAYVAGRLQQDGLCVECAVQGGSPVDTILQHAQVIGARLIVMATHGRTGLGRLLLGSVALEVVHRSLLPVLLVRPTGLPSA